eukprot:Rmarinus@m.25069
MSSSARKIDPNSSSRMNRDLRGDARGDRERERERDMDPTDLAAVREGEKKGDWKAMAGKALNWKQMSSSDMQSFNFEGIFNTGRLEQALMGLVNKVKDQDKVIEGLTRQLQNTVSKEDTVEAHQIHKLQRDISFLEEKLVLKIDKAQIEKEQREWGTMRSRMEAAIVSIKEDAKKSGLVVGQQAEEVFELKELVSQLQSSKCDASQVELLQRALLNALREWKECDKRIAALTEWNESLQTQVNKLGGDASGKRVDEIEENANRAFSLALAHSGAEKAMGVQIEALRKEVAEHKSHLERLLSMGDKDEVQIFQSLKFQKNIEGIVETLQKQVAEQQQVIRDLSGDMGDSAIDAVFDAPPAGSGKSADFLATLTGVSPGLDDDDNEKSAMFRTGRSRIVRVQRELANKADVQDVKQMRIQLHALHKECERLSATVTQGLRFSEDANMMQRDVATLEKDVASLEIQLKALRKESGRRDYGDRVDERVDALEEEMAALRAVAGRMESTIEDLMRKTRKSVDFNVKKPKERYADPLRERLQSSKDSGKHILTVLDGHESDSSSSSSSSSSSASSGHRKHGVHSIRTVKSLSKSKAKEKAASRERAERSLKEAKKRDKSNKKSRRSADQAERAMLAELELEASAALAGKKKAAKSSKR